MKEFKALVLGTDHNSYAVARSYNEAFNDKALVVGSAILLPFINSKIAEIYTRENFSSDDDVFVELLNEIGKKYKNTEFVFFAPTEAYIDILLRNLDSLDFDYKIAYPKREIGQKFILKSNFYDYLETIGLPYPKSQIISKDNIDSLELDGDLFMKADQYNDFVKLDFDQKQKGYKISGKDKAKSVLEDIYKSGYKGQMIVQQYINGQDGSEYSVNGYRSKDGKVSMVQARNIFSDKRKMWVGNHIVQVDSNDSRIYEISQKIVDSLDYKGLFNLDFKIDKISDKIYTLEMNVRQGRTFYYSNLGGVNLIELAIKDQVFDQSFSLRPNKKFRLMTLTENALEKNIDSNLLIEFKDKDRLENSANPIIYDKDSSFKRKLRIKDSIKRLEKEILG